MDFQELAATAIVSLTVMIMTRSAWLRMRSRKGGCAGHGCDCPAKRR